MIRIDKDCRWIVINVLLGAAVVVFLLFHFVKNTWITLPLSALAIWFALFILYFFRIPERKSVGSDKDVCSVADGQIVIIGKVFEGEYLKREAIQISVFMNFFDMHANYWPVDGEITYYKYHPGKHWLAFKPKASEENEHTSTAIKTPSGQEVFFKQLAGTFARRVVNYAKVGDKVKAGEQCGIIKFGSRIDMYLPLDAELEVKLKDVTRACETLIARLR